MGHLYLQSKSFDLAIEESNKVLGTSQIKCAHLLLGRAYLGKREPAKASAAFKTVTELAPQDPTGYYYLGLAYRLQKQDDGALTTFEKALSLDAHLTDALSQITAIYMAKGDTVTALKRVQKHLQVLPNNPLLYNLLGGIYTLQNNDAKAEEAFKQAIKLDENVLISYLNLGNLYVKNQSYEQAIRQYEAVIKANPTVLPPYMLLGVIYDLQGKHPKANEYYQQVLKINPRFGPAANNLAWNYAEHNGNIDVALSLAQTAKEQLPDAPAVSDTLGWIYYKECLSEGHQPPTRECREALTIRLSTIIWGWRTIRRGSRARQGSLGASATIEPGLSW